MDPARWGRVAGEVEKVSQPVHGAVFSDRYGPPGYRVQVVGREPVYYPDRHMAALAAETLRRYGYKVEAPLVYVGRTRRAG